MVEVTTVPFPRSSTLTCIPLCLLSVACLEMRDLGASEMLATFDGHSWNSWNSLH